MHLSKYISRFVIYQDISLTDFGYHEDSWYPKSVFDILIGRSSLCEGLEDGYLEKASFKFYSTIIDEL